MASKTLPKGITQRPDGRYMARFQHKGEKYCLYDYDLENLQRRITDLRYEVSHGVYAKEGKATVDSWFEIWLKDYKINNLKEATIFRYKSAYENHIKPVIGDKKLRDIRPEHIQRLYNSLSGMKTVSIVASILSGMFEQAFKNQIINKNPIPMTTVPKQRNDKREMRVLTIEEQEILLKNSHGNLKDLIEVSLSTGLRTGELRALEWNDIDFENKIIHVTGTLTEIDGRAFKDTPKTKSSRRDIPMLENVERIFLNKKEEQADKKEKMGERYRSKKGLENLIFRSRTGTPISNSCYVRMINRTVNRINGLGIEFEHIHPHTFRHTFATRCIEKGIPPQVLKTILGHASLAMTMDLYAHVLPDTKAEEMKKIASLF
ncbi:transposase from transposon Tn916 [Clostridiales bacterium]|nr:transposase from transposon Tn916 [Clostridiales bacterium]